MPPTSEIKPGVHVDMDEFGRRPDQAVTDMSHQARNREAAAASTAGELNKRLGIGASENTPTKPV